MIVILLKCRDTVTPRLNSLPDSRLSASRRRHGRVTAPGRRDTRDLAALLGAEAQRCRSQFVRRLFPRLPEGGFRQPGTPAVQFLKPSGPVRPPPSQESAMHRTFLALAACAAVGAGGMTLAQPGDHGSGERK